MSKTMVESREPGEKVTTGKLSIIMFSGTADKFIPLGVLAQAAGRKARAAQS